MPKKDQTRREVRVRPERTHDAPDGLGEINVGDRVRAKTTNRTGQVTDVAHDGTREQVTVSYDDAPQDIYLTTPAREGAQLPRELVDPA
jgi:hypothetical protein